MTDTESETVLWRGMTRPELDLAYDNNAAVPDGRAMVGAWAEESAAMRAAAPDGLDLAYGDKPRQKLDLFRCGRPDAPLFCFIHGGYWQRNAKEGFAVMGKGALARGLDVALIGYTLAPEARLTGIVAEIAAAIAWLRREGPAQGVAKTRLVVSGWSAGGHLAAAMMGEPGVDAGLPISGIFDVEPCRLNYLNEKLLLDAPEAAATSPLLHLPAKAGPMIVAYGTDELPELQRQSRDYEAAWRQAGLQSRVLPVAGCNHFSVLGELIRPDGLICEAAVTLAEA